MQIEVGTLKELNVQPGDVVELVARPRRNDGWIYGSPGKTYTIGDVCFWNGVSGQTVKSGSVTGIFRIVSRATPAEPASEEITWGEWGPPSDGAADGDYMERCINGKTEWRYPVQKQPVVETVKLSGGYFGAYGWRFENGISGWNVTYCITFETKDGEPDWSTLRGEDIS